MKFDPITLAATRKVQNFLSSLPPQLPPGNDPYNWAAIGLNQGTNTPGGVGSISVPSTLNNGSYLSIEPSGASFTLFNSASAAVWTRTAAALNANATKIANVLWVDTVEATAYVLAVNTSTNTIYPCRVSIASGAVSPVGTGISISPNFVYSAMFRDAQGEGDLTLYGYTSSDGGLPRSVSISSVTGEITIAEAPLVLGGASFGRPAQSGMSVAYKTVDKSIVVMNPLRIANMLVLMVCRDNKSAIFTVNSGLIPTTSIATSTGAHFNVVGDNVYLTGGLLVQGSVQPMARTAFDAYLIRVCEYFGI